MGQTDDIMMKSRPNTYMYTPITRGHKPTPSQESNTLSEASCTTNLSADSGPLSPTYREEEEESRLQDFTDDELDSLSASGHSSPRLSPRLGGHRAAAANGCITAGAGRTPPPCIDDRVPSLGLAAGRSRVDHESGLTESRSNLSQLDGGSLRSGESGGDRFRDSIDTVVRVSLGSPQDSRTSTLRSGEAARGERITSGPGPQLECIFRMSNELKSSSGQDYGSFCKAGGGGGGGGGGGVGGPAPLALEKGGSLPTAFPSHHQQQQRQPDQPDNVFRFGPGYHRSPLLPDSDSEEDNSSPPKARKQPPDPAAGSPVKPAEPSAEDTEEEGDAIPKEPLKTLVSALFLATGFVATTSSLAITHESVPEIDPLPDVILDNVSYQQWGLDVSEILIMISTFSAFMIVMLHSYRLIILRRIWLIMGCLYYYRAITMFVTVLPKSDPSYTCHPKLDNNTALPVLVLVKRVFVLMSGMGLSINGKHIYCGDYIFSGHTMVLTLGYLVIKEYSPRRFFVLHWTSLVVSLLGVILLLIARGHYSIDCILAYYVTTRLWWIYHTLAHNNNLKTRGTHNFLANMWWWLLFRYFELNIHRPLPRRYSLPLPDRLTSFCRRKLAARRQRQQQQPPPPGAVP